MFKKKESCSEQHIVLLTAVGSDLEYLQIANVLDEHEIPFYKGGGSSIYQGAQMDGRRFIHVSNLDYERAKELIDFMPLIRVESYE